jgi:hypothetical protein
VIWNLVLIAILAYIQNMAFTWSSRSRNSGDPAYHRKAAWASNGVFFVTNGLLFSVLTPIIRGEVGWWWFVIAGLVYCAATTEGSVYMMRRLIARETGKRKVGA